MSKSPEPSLNGNSKNAENEGEVSEKVSNEQGQTKNASSFYYYVSQGNQEAFQKQKQIRGQKKGRSRSESQEKNSASRSRSRQKRRPQIKKPIRTRSPDSLNRNQDRAQRKQRMDKASRHNPDNRVRNDATGKQEAFRKTKICPQYEKGLCRKGNSCNYAHGETELRGLPDFRKTRLCIAFKEGKCGKPSSECKYAHGQGELRRMPKNSSQREREKKRSRSPYQSYSRAQNPPPDYYQIPPYYANYQPPQVNSSYMIHPPPQSNVPRSGSQNMPPYQNPYFHHDYQMNPPPQSNLPYPNSQAPYYPPPYQLPYGYQQQQPNSTYGNPPYNNQPKPPQM